MRCQSFFLYKCILFSRQAAAPKGKKWKKYLQEIGKTILNIWQNSQKKLVKFIQSTKLIQIREKLVRTY